MEKSRTYTIGVDILALRVLIYKLSAHFSYSFSLGVFRI